MKAFGIILCAGLVASPAVGQRPVAREDVPPVISVDDMPAARAKPLKGELTPFGTCIVAHDVAAARALIAAPPASAGSRDAALAMGRKGAVCAELVGKFRKNDVAIRGAVAERLYVTTYATAPIAPPSPPTDYVYTGGPAMVRYEVARCAALRNPVAADALVRSAAGSAEETGALRLVSAAAGDCIPPHTNMGFDRGELHALLADALLFERGGS